MKKLITCFIFSLLIIGCGGKSEEDYMKQAKENVEKNNITAAVDNYQKLVDEYPNSKNAPEALFQMASLYQNKMLKNLSDYESLDKAAKIYKEIYDKYPKNEKAPTSLFMSAFIQANELNKYDEATKSYKLFLEKYPDHELAASAKDELAHMGLSPNDILEKKSDKNI